MHTISDDEHGAPASEDVPRATERGHTVCTEPLDEDYAYA